MRTLVFLLAAVALTAPAAPAYTVKTLDQLAIYPQSSVNAQVVPDNESRIAAEVTARIESIPVKVGQSARKGDTLVVLDQRQYKLALEQANNQVELLTNRYKLAQSQFESAKALHASQFISSQLLEQRRTELAVVDSELKIARSSAAQAKLSLEKTVLRAPFSGAVKERLVGEGELAAPGQPIVALVEFAQNELRARVSNRDISDLKSAKAIEFRQGGETYPVKILRIAPNIDPRAQTRDVVLKADAPLLSGSAGELVWSSAVPHLPAAYLQQRDRQAGVWVEEGGKPVFKSLSDAQAGRPVPVRWPLNTRIIDQGRFTLAAPSATPAGNTK
jgi:membrane fusion protein (multidrug efflux system)